MHSVQYTVQTVKCTHIISWTITLTGETKKRVAGISQGPTRLSSGILRHPKGDYLDRGHSYQKVLEAIRLGSLVLVIIGQDSQNYLKGPSGLSQLRSDCSHDSQAGG
jgi:hypothetical protein